MDKNKLTQNISLMKEWLKSQPHMPQTASEDDGLLEAFIQGFNPYLSLAKLKLDAYYTFRGQFSNPYFNNRDPQKLKWYSVMKYMMLDERTPEGDYVLLAIPPKGETKKYYSAEESAKLSLMILDSYMRQHQNSKMSLYVVLDAASFTQELLNKHTPQHLKTFHLILEAYPVKVKGVISFNIDKDKMELGRRFNQEWAYQDTTTINEVVLEHKSLSKFLPLEILPRDYEHGENLPIKALWEGVQQRLEREQDWFITNGSQTTIEHLRL